MTAHTYAIHRKVAHLPGTTIVYDSSDHALATHCALVWRGLDAPETGEAVDRVGAADPLVTARRGLRYAREGGGRTGEGAGGLQRGRNGGVGGGGGAAPGGAGAAGAAGEALQRVDSGWPLRPCPLPPHSKPPAAPKRTNTPIPAHRSLGHERAAAMSPASWRTAGVSGASSSRALLPR